MKNAVSILKDHQLRNTEARVDVLNTFLGQHHALSHSDVEKTLGEQYDRVTIYRTLTSFMEKGLLHKVPVDDGSTRYALCNDHCDDHQHEDNHIHFKCTSCGNTECLDELPIPQVKLPNGYTLTETNFLVQGVCGKCNG